MIDKLLKSANLTNKLFVPISEETEIWDSIPEEMRIATIKEAESLLDYSWEEIRLSLFQEFSKNGNRSHFQNIYFKKRKTLSILTTAECLERKGRFIEQIADGIWSILSEPSWVIPAHNSYIRDTKQLTAPLTFRPILDLFACETGEIISLSLQLLRKELEAKIGEPFIESVLYELRQRILKPYLEENFWWMGGERLNNWTVWCTQNVLLSISALSLSDEELRGVTDKAAASIQQWLDQYGEDGACDEGASYWHAAGLCLWGCLDILNKMSNGAIAPLMQESKIKNIGHYIINVLVGDDIYLNFADCSPKAGLLGVREYLFGIDLKDEEMIQKSLEDWKKDYKERYIEKKNIQEPEDDNYNLWYRVLNLINAKEMLNHEAKNITNKVPYTPLNSIGLYIYRKGEYTLAVKAGCNDDSHNHNDVGSIILYKNTHPQIIDVGVETYSAKTFSPERYTLWPMQSFYHNLCNFGQYMQLDGEDYKATDIIATDRSISMELKEAYPKEAGVSSYKREVSIDNEFITIKDTIKGEIPPTLSIMTMDKPVYDENKLSFDNWNIELTKTNSIKIEEIEITDERLLRAWTGNLYRTLIDFDTTLSWRIKL